MATVWTAPQAVLTARYKLYPSARKIALPREPAGRGLEVAEAIRRRRSERRFSGQAMFLRELSHLLHYSAGITQEQHGLRAWPSAGAMYPIEVYPLVNHVEGLARGLYHYSPAEHSLEVLREADLRDDLVRAALGQKFVGRANVALALSIIFRRTLSRYGQRGQRYVLLDAGHLAQNVYLVATSLGMGACGVGAFRDDLLNALVGVDGREEAALYLVAVGKL